MNTNSKVLISIGALLPLLAAGCGSKQEEPRESHSASSSHAISSHTAEPPPPMPIGDVDCGVVHDHQGVVAHVIAFANGSGRAGCTEAITVAHDYIGGATGQSATTVDGWHCQPQPDATVPHVCSASGLVIGLRGQAAPASPPPPAPVPVHTLHPDVQPKVAEPEHSQPAPPPPAAHVAGEDTTNCGPVKDAGGNLRVVEAMGTPVGRVGCTEAIDVAAEYAATIGTSDIMTVSGWLCRPHSEGKMSQICEKDGLKIGLRNA